MKAIESIPSRSKGLLSQSTGLLSRGTKHAKRMASRTGDLAILSVHKRPMKSLLLAGAAGAVIALLAGIAARPRH